MDIKRFWDYKVEEDDLVYRYINEKNEIQEGRQPLRVLGQRNPKLDIIIAGVKQTMSEIAEMKKAKAGQNHTANEAFLNKSVKGSSEPVMIPDDAEADTDLEEEKVLEGEEIADEQEKQEANYEEVEESKKKKWLRRAGYVALVAAITIAIAVGVRSCSKNDKVATPVASTTSSQTTIDDLKADSRYTKITETMLVSTTEDFVKELAKHGITVTASDALTYVTMANITHIKETNPELLTKVLGENDSVETLSKTGHIIGQIVTNEVTTKDDTIDWTIAFIDETDRKIAAHGAGYVVEGAKKIAADETLKEEEKIAKIQALVENKFVAPNFDKTVGYTFNDGSKITLSQEEGADFISDAVITGILMGDNTLKNYINAENKYKNTNDSTWVTTTSYGEVSADLKAISENADNVPNLMKMIDGCKALDSSAASISENKSK